MRTLFHFFLFLLGTWQAIAQTYPVQVVPVLTPPYSSKIADYANPMANRVQLQVITTDLSVQNRSVQLYVEIKGNGFTAASVPVLSGVSPLRISGGEILRLTNAELAPFFQLRNLQGISSEQYASPLPDGVYTFCFRVRDVLSGRWLSQHQCTVAYLMLNDPPILNIPTDNEQVAVTDFQNIIFSWTPRQINATNVSYTFELREILDPTLDPHFAFEVSRRVLKEDDLRMTTFVYDVSKPNLIPGRRYAWRVRAISTGGLAENSVFKNNGYSEVHTFVYAVNCSKPLFLLSEQQGKSRTKLLWQGHTLHQKYHIQYRKKGVANAQWFEASTRNTQALITDLEAGEYEFRVGASCEGERYGITPSYVYSDIQTFKIEKTPNTTEQGYNCGIVPKITITNQKPLNSLVTNEVFTAGDFAVTLLEVSGSNGVFSGKGFIKVPYLNDTKLAVEFENVKINSDYQLTDGVVKTTYDADWKNVQFIENLIGQGKKSNEINVPFEIDKVETRNGEIVVTGKDGRKEVFPFGGNDSTVKGKVTTTTNGVTSTQEKIYHIDKDGKVSEPQTVAQGGKPTKENTNGVSKNGEATALTAKGIEVTFENTADSKYAYEVPTKAYSKDYQKLDGKYIPFKAVVKGETEPFLAKVHITDRNISADSLIFKTDKGALIESKRVEGSDDFLLTLKGFHSFAVEQVQATIKQGKKYQIAGVFNLVHLSPKTAKVTLIPTAENLTIDVEKVKAIYSKVGVTLDITWAAPFDITPYLTNGVLETKDVFGDLTDYSPSQQAVISAYKATGKVADDTYYVFITNAKSSTGQGGYMALGGQFGFVFDQTERTLAHELGHGIFKLAHPFKKKQQGNVPSLMDYTSDEDLLFADWKQINDPAFKIGIFQGQSEGEHVGEDPVFERLREALEKLEGNAFLKCKFCQEETIPYKENRQQPRAIDGKFYSIYLPPVGNTQWYSTDSKKNSKKYKCYLATIDSLVGLSESLLPRDIDKKKEEVALFLKEFKEALSQSPKDFLFVRSDLLQTICNVPLFFPEDFCTTSTISDSLRKYTLKELEACMDIKKRELHQTLSDKKILLKKDLEYIRSQLREGQLFDWEENGKVYTLSPEGFLIEKISPLSAEAIREGNWQGTATQYARFHRSKERKIQLSAFGFRKDLPVLKGKKADLVALSEHILQQTNTFFKPLKEVTDKPQLSPDPDTFADGRRFVISEQASYLRLFSEGTGIVTTLLKTGEVEENVYLEQPTKETYIQAPGVITGSTEVIAQKVTDVTSLATTVYGIVVDAQVRRELKEEFIALKEQIGDDPQVLYSIFKEIVLTALSGNTSEEWASVTNTDTDTGKRSHLATRAAGNVIISAMVGTQLVKELPKMGKKLAQETKKVEELAKELIKELTKKVSNFPQEIKAILEDTKRFDTYTLTKITQILTSTDSEILEKLLNAQGFDKVLADMAQYWTKFQGGEFQIAYAKRLIAEGKIISFEVSNLSDDLHRIYDIEVVTFKEGRKIIKLLELKNWNRFYPETIKNQFLKDLQKMNDLGDIQWIFAKTNNISDLQTLKAKVIEALKTADGKPIEELEKLFVKPNDFTEKIKRWIGGDKSSAELLLEWLDKPENFKKFFEVVN